ncbi:MAG: hypothetical protein E7015_00960 [Alphaproteobacteria bacterium]|nr:hypothetical protein [Alphaproteobacteria bacterium]
MSIKKKFFQIFRSIKKPQKGYAAIVVAVAMIVFILFFQYIRTGITQSDVQTSTFETPYAIAQSIANKFNPGRSWEIQADYLYSVGAQTYNDRYYNAIKSRNSFFQRQTQNDSLLPISRNLPLYIQSQDVNISSNIVPFLIENLQQEAWLFDHAVTDSLNMDEKGQIIRYKTYSASPSPETDKFIPDYDPDSNIMSVDFDEQNGKIVCECPKLGLQAIATLPVCDVDIVLAIPTNQACCTEENNADENIILNSDNVPIKQIARACQTFLSENFLHTVGVAVGVVPYSGKISLPPDRKDWTTRADMSSPRLVQDKFVEKPYITQAMFYGSDGQEGGELLAENEDDYGEYSNWGTTDIGLPIMARRGNIFQKNGANIYSGSSKTFEEESLLISFVDPIYDGKDLSYKFLQMNPNPCYLGYCNTLAMLCERKCPTFLANPYFISELTSDIPSVINDLNLYTSFPDKKNKSNFLFLAPVWTGNLLSNWTKHPCNHINEGSDTKVIETPRENKKKVVIIIANAPDRFEPVELTYLGFNNDNSEIPMFESDTVQFNNGGYVVKDGGYQGVKGAIKCKLSSGAANIEELEVQNVVPTKTKNEENSSDNQDEKSSDSVAPLTTINSIVRGLKANQDNSVLRVSFPYKGIIKVVASKGEPANVTFYGGEEGNHITENVQSETPHYFSGVKSFFFSGDKNIQNMNNNSEFNGNYTTKGVNFGHNLSVHKIKYRAKHCILKKMELSNQVLRFYGKYDPNELGKNLIPNTNGHPNKTPTISRMDSGIDCPQNSGDTAESVETNGYWEFFQNLENTKTNENEESPQENTDSFIRSYNFRPIALNVGSIRRVVFVTDNFPSEDFDASDNEDSAIKLFSTENEWQSIGSAKSSKDNGNLLYRVIDTYPQYESTQLLFGTYRYYSQKIYHDLYTYQNTRKRYVTRTVDITRKYKNLCNGVAPTVLTSATQTQSGNNKVTSYSYSCDYSPYMMCCYSRGNLNIEKGGQYTIGKKTEDDETLYACNGVSWNDDYPITNWEQISSKMIDQSTEEPVDYGVYSCTSIGSVPDPVLNDDNQCKPISGSCEPILMFRNTYQTTQIQSVDCLYKEGCAPFGEEPAPPSIGVKSVNCSNCGLAENSVENDSDEKPEFTLECDSCTTTSSDETSSSTAGEWIVIPEQKYLYAITDYDESANVTKHSVKSFNTLQNDASTITENGITYEDYSATNLIELKDTAEADTHLWSTSPYRYDLYNFFVVGNNVFEQKDFYEYDTVNNTRKIKNTDVFVTADNDPKLLNNQNMYLQEDKEAEKDPSANIDDTNWICFCGDADVLLEFEAWDTATLNFSHIDTTKRHRVLLDNRVVVDTIGNEIHSFSDDEAQAFYIMPDQITDDKDEEGNYYLDINMSKNANIVSIEINNRPYKIVKQGNQPIIKVDGSSQSKFPISIVGEKNIELVSELNEPIQIIADVPQFSISPKDFFDKEGNANIYCSAKEFSIDVKASTPPDPGNNWAILKKNGNQGYLIQTSRLLDENTTKIQKCLIPQCLHGDKVKKVGTYEEVAENKSVVVHIPKSETNTITLKGYIPTKLTFSDIEYENKTKWNGNKCISISDATNYYMPDCAKQYLNGQKKDWSNDCNAPTFRLVGKASKYNTAWIYAYAEMPGTFTTITGNNQSAVLSSDVEIGSELSRRYDFISINNIHRTSLCVWCPHSNNTETCGTPHWLRFYMNGITFSEEDTKKKFTTSGNGTMTTKWPGKAAVTVELSTPTNQTTGISLENAKMEIDGSFGNYKYALPSDSGYYLTGLQNCTLKYKDGSFAGQTLPNLGSNTSITVDADQFKEQDSLYVATVNAKNVRLSLTNSSGKIGHFNINYKSIINISPAEYDFKLQSDGKYHVTVPCNNVYIESIDFAHKGDAVAYDHPDAKNNVQQINIFDGGGNRDSNNAKTYGQMMLDLSNFIWSPIQKLFYYNKKNNSDVLFERAKDTPGDFFVHIWDHNDDIPEVRWKLKNKIQEKDYTHDDFGTFKSSYGFSGLHRMFLPHGTFDDNIAAFSKANNSALVFAGFTLPSNTMLTYNKYQESTLNDEKIITSVTPPETALAKVAIDACKKLRNIATVYLIKYRTDETLSLESCVPTTNTKYAKDEDELKNVLTEIAAAIKSEQKDLTIDVQKLSE